jgi:hypothetical protein
MIEFEVVDIVNRVVFGGGLFVIQRTWSLLA